MAQPGTQGLGFINHPWQRRTVIDKIAGCMVGSALGDSIGLYTEAMTKSFAARRYPKQNRKFSLVDPVTRRYESGNSHKQRFQHNGWTDATDQALLFVLPWIDNVARGHNENEANHIVEWHYAQRLHEWFREGIPALRRLPIGTDRETASVLRKENYLHNPQQAAYEYWAHNSNRNSACNASVMRSHPIGIVSLARTEEDAFELARDIARLTHPDPRCMLSSCISAGLIRGIVRGEVTDEAGVDRVIESAYDWLLDEAQDAQGFDEDPDLEAIERLFYRADFERYLYATGFPTLALSARTMRYYTYKCIGVGVLALRMAIRGTEQNILPPTQLFERIITQVAMEAGEADTNAEVAGALVGAWLGRSLIPDHWADGLAHRGWLDSKVERLLTAIQVVPGVLQHVADESGPLSEMRG